MVGVGEQERERERERERILNSPKSRATAAAALRQTRSYHHRCRRQGGCTGTGERGKGSLGIRRKMGVFLNESVDLAECLGSLSFSCLDQ